MAFPVVLNQSAMLAGLVPYAIITDSFPWKWTLIGNSFAANHL